MPKVTVYIANYNYAHYIEQAIDSVLNQTFQDFELLIFDDGSTDNSKQILKKYKNNPKVKLFFQKNQGHVATSNNAIKASTGEYIIRLDADDWFDESALLVLSHVLDSKPDIALVYPDYHEVDSDGNLLGMVRRKKIGSEVKILDLPMHGACTMIRKSVLEDVGGYRKDIRHQDGFDLWIKIIQKYTPYNVNIPLFYYRKHSTSITTQSKKILADKRYIKEKFVEERNLNDGIKSCVIIPVRKGSPIHPNLPLEKVGGKPLIAYSIESALKSNADKVIVATEDNNIADVAKNFGAEVIMRPEELAREDTKIEPTILYVLEKLREQNFVPNIVSILYSTSPLIRSTHINETINTLLIFDSDSVVSVKENPSLHYKHGENGLEPIFRKRGLKSEREFLYEESGGIITTKTDVINSVSLVGEKISHIILTEDEAVDIEDKFTFWLARKIIENRKEVDELDNRRLSRGY
tara:strand:+ start:8282 stop:9676 length:1395 start_codon:yes stop_codon:yes gene_type:complete